MITDKDYFRVTNCVGSGCNLPGFSIEEVQELLNAWGYQVIIHKGLAKCEEVEMGMNEVNRTGKYNDYEREIIIALKNNFPVLDIPKRVDECFEYEFKRVFNREIKQRLMKFLINLK